VTTIVPPLLKVVAVHVPAVAQLIAPVWFVM
jgi:hypothetical protein